LHLALIEPVAPLAGLTPPNASELAKVAISARDERAAALAFHDHGGGKRALGGSGPINEAVRAA